MKKILVILALATATLTVNAQDMMSKRGTPILPETGEWSLGFDATNLIHYAGNLFSQAGNPSSTLGPQQPLTIVGLYVKDDHTRYRGKVGINFASVTNTFPVSATPTITDTSEIKTSGTSITLGIGMQKERGKGRLYGFYGAQFELGFGNGASTQDITYAKALAATDVATRVTQTKTGGAFDIGLTGFIGVEYFFAPKTSLSAEYGWGLVLHSVGAGSQTSETADGTAVTTKSADTAKSSSFGILNMDAGSIVLHFYF